MGGQRHQGEMFSRSHPRTAHNPTLGSLGWEPKNPGVSGGGAGDTLIGKWKQVAPDAACAALHGLSLCT